MSEEKDVKPGSKSSEFLAVIITTVGLIAGALVGKLDAGLVAIILGVLAGLYTIARTIVKITPSTKDDEILDMIKEKILDQIVPKK
jgi:4-hydroxybenzoate polyprenyltransferase